MKSTFKKSYAYYCFVALLLTNGCANNTQELTQETAKKDNIYTSKFSDYGFETNPQKIPFKRFVIYSSDYDYCSKINHHKVGKIDISQIIQESSFAKEREKAYFEKEDVRKLEYALRTARISDKKSQDETAAMNKIFLEIMKQEWKRIHNDLINIIKPEIEKISIDKKLVIIFNSNLLPDEILSCGNYLDITPQVLYFLNKA